MLVFALLAAGLVAVGYVHFHDYEQHYRTEVERQLSVVAELKAGELAAWRSERLADATVLWLPLAAETALFRVAQGALANAAAHARATRVQVLLAATPDRATLSIADDGAGFDVAHAALAHASWGLAIMRERAEAVGATLRIDTAPGRGTRVVVEIEREAA